MFHFYYCFGLFSKPSRRPSSQPSKQPIRWPSSQPSKQPIRRPTGQPSRQPTRYMIPQYIIPLLHPHYTLFYESCSISLVLSLSILLPSLIPLYLINRFFSPSFVFLIFVCFGLFSQPSRQPRMCPSSQPTEQPTMQPTRQPMRIPSSQPTTDPTRQPTQRPSKPTSQPSFRPSKPSGIILSLIA